MPEIPRDPNISPDRYEDLGGFKRPSREEAEALRQRLNPVSPEDEEGVRYLYSALTLVAKKEAKE